MQRASRGARHPNASFVVRVASAGASSSTRAMSRRMSRVSFRLKRFVVRIHIVDNENWVWFTREFYYNAIMSVCDGV